VVGTGDYIPEAIKVSLTGVACSTEKQRAQRRQRSNFLADSVGISSLLRKHSSADPPGTSSTRRRIPVEQLNERLCATPQRDWIQYRLCKCYQREVSDRLLAIARPDKGQQFANSDRLSLVRAIELRL
jgi:hypothetical protein